MKVSVAMCTYNGMPFLIEQLQSIARQDRLPDELVICDDGSTDTTMEILQDFCKSACFAVHIFRNERNLGSTKNFERAISRCEGEIIVLADQDDVWREDKLATIERVFDLDREVICAFSDALVVNENLEPMGYNLWTAVRLNQWEQEQINKGFAFPILLQRNVVTGATMAIRSSLREFIMPISELWVHDYWISFIASVLGRVFAISEPLIKYRSHPHQQIGITEPGRYNLFRRVRTRLRVNRSSYLQEAAKFTAIRHHLHAKVSSEKSATVLPQLDGKINHYTTRGMLPEGRLHRVRYVTKELITGRYRLYSNGYLSALGDLIC